MEVSCIEVCMGCVSTCNCSVTQLSPLAPVTHLTFNSGARQEREARGGRREVSEVRDYVTPSPYIAVS